MQQQTFKEINFQFITSSKTSAILTHRFNGLDQSKQIPNCTVLATTLFHLMW